MERWSLKALYTGYEDENYKRDIEKLENIVDTLKQMAQDKWSVADDTIERKGEVLKEALSFLEQYHVLYDKTGNFASLQQSADTMDVETVKQLDKIKKIESEMSKPIAIFHKYVKRIVNLEELIEKNPELKVYEFFLKDTKKQAQYTLSEEAEDIISKFHLSGGSGWEDMRDYLTSTMDIDYKGEKVTLSDIRNMAYSPEKEVRKAAYEAELNSYAKVKDAVSYSLNNIKLQVMTECELRGYASPLEMTLEASHMKRETLDAMLQEMKKFLPKFRQYLKRKGELLGYQNGLPFYELFAPLGESHRKFTIEETKEYLVGIFKGFSEDLADMIERAFTEEWIDFFPRKGKVGGAFCANLPFIGQSRILTNFDGSLGDVVTLAHELGHAYHGLQIESHKPLNWSYSMPVAETASTFNETVVMDTLIKEAEGEEKLVLIENQLQDITQIMLDIYSRYLFETAVFENRKEGFLFSEQLEQMMLDAQKEAYGDGLDQNYLHPYMWICKPHYYSAELSFYNFPYAFGGLFARGLYARYQEEGKEFIDKYRKMLYGTTVNSVEDVAKIAGIDLTKADFWRESLQSFSDLVDEFLRLSEE